MPFADRAANPPPPRKLCELGKVIHQVPDDEREHLVYMIATPDRWGHTGADSIQEAIEAELGVRVSDRTIRLHRGGTCVCTGTRPRS
jgi:hypothetical protein